MVGALWTGISGLAGQQTALNNESNNIANVNTIGYKSSRVSFADQMYQNKIGSGTTILDTEKLYKQGSLKLTGVAYDMALRGDGFFEVKPQGTSDLFYTRAGNFRMGTDGTLQDSSGNAVQGWTMTALETSDIITTNANISTFTENYTKLAASYIIKKDTSVETITAKMTDYTATAVADDKSLMSGAGYKTKSAKIADIEALVSSYTKKLSDYSLNPNSTSTPAISASGYIDFDLDNIEVSSGDQIYIYVNGTKYSQSFDTDEETTLKKLTDQLSQFIPGINAYIADDQTKDIPSSSVDSTNPSNVIIIDSLIPGKSFTLGDAGFVDGSATTLKTASIITAAVEGSGLGAVNSAMEALRDVAAGNQKDVWKTTDIGTLTTGDKIKYSLPIGESTYTIEIQEGQTSVTTDISDSTVATVTSVTDSNKVDQMVIAINSHSEMSQEVIAMNINGSLVVQSVVSGVEFSGSLTVDYNPSVVANTGSTAATATTLETGETFEYDMSGAINTNEEIEFKITNGGVDYAILMTGGSKTVTIDIGGTRSTLTLTESLDGSNGAAMMAEAIEQVAGLKDEVVAAKNSPTTTQLDLTWDGSDSTAISLTYGVNNDASSTITSSKELTTKNRNSDYSLNSGGGAEFLQIRTSIDQTASKNSLQLKLTELDISDSAFGDFAVDSAGLVTMKQDGATFAIGQVAIALFNNNRGLMPEGNNLLSTTVDSGKAIFNTNNRKTAEVMGNTVELSTADLSESLVNLMVFQRAFEANAKSITTADKILETLIQLKR